MIEATGFAEKINTTQNPQILDVRTPEEFTQGHIDDKRNWLGDNFVAEKIRQD
jgi:rhodanese-related sulfurtransferase